MSDKYIISEEQLLNFLRQEEVLNALFDYGVHFSWGDYDDALAVYKREKCPSAEDFEEIAYIKLINEYSDMKVE